MNKQTILLSTLLVACIPNIASANSFNNYDVKGGYAFRLEGTSSIVLVDPTRTVATGQLLADGAGHISGHGSFRSAGLTCAATITGTYDIAPNGAGGLSSTMTSVTSGCTTEMFNLAVVLSDKGASVDGVSTGNDNLIGKFTRQGKVGFKLSDFSGSYAMRLAGTSTMVSAKPSLTVGVGILTTDGQGRLGGIGTMRSANVTCHGVFKGTYKVATDGAGSMTTLFTTSDPGCVTRAVDFNMALLQKGNGAEIASAENDYMAGSLHRQTPK